MAEIYGTDVSPDLISKITDAVLEDVKAWQSRPLEAIYPIVYLDALRAAPILSCVLGKDAPTGVRSTRAAATRS